MTALVKIYSVVFLLLTLITLSVSRPRTTINHLDILASSTAPQPGKGEGGKHQLIKKSHSESSSVDYAVTKDVESKNDVATGNPKKVDKEEYTSTQRSILKKVLHGSSVNQETKVASEPIDVKPDTKAPLKSKLVDTLNKSSEPDAKVPSKTKLADTLAKSSDKSKTEVTSLKPEKAILRRQGTERENVNPDTPSATKADGKEEDLTTDVPQTGRGKEEVVNIGQFPLPPPLPLMPGGFSRVVLLLPFDGLMPPPPALHVSDRLPAADEASSETAEDQPKDFSEEIKRLERMRDLISGIINLRLPPPQTSYFPDGEKDDLGEEKSKTVDAMGKKFQVKTKMAKLPLNGNGRFFIKFISLRPLNSDLMNTELEETTEATEVNHEYKRKLIGSGKEYLDEIVGDDIPKVDATFRMGKNTSNLNGVTEESDVLKTEESRVKENAHSNGVGAATKVPEEKFGSDMAKTLVGIEGSTGSSELKLDYKSDLIPIEGDITVRAKVLDDAESKKGKLGVGDALKGELADKTVTETEEGNSTDIIQKHSKDEGRMRVKLEGKDNVVVSKGQIEGIAKMKQIDVPTSSLIFEER